MVSPSVRWPSLRVHLEDADAALQPATLAWWLGAARQIRQWERHDGSSYGPTSASSSSPTRAFEVVALDQIWQCYGL